MNKLDYMSADAENEHNDEKRTLKKEDYDTEHNEDIYDEKCFKGCLLLMNLSFTDLLTWLYSASFYSS